MNQTAALFFQIGEPLAAGLFEEPDASTAKKFCRAYRRYFENCPVPVYDHGKPLFPACEMDRSALAVTPEYGMQYGVNFRKLEAKSPEAAAIFREFHKKHGDFHKVDGMEQVMQYTSYIDACNHSALNYKRITLEGIDQYDYRVRRMQDRDLSEALLDVITGIRDFHSRCVTYLESVDAEPKLIAALKKVPFHPAENGYEALVSANFMLNFDRADNIGYVDSWLPKVWKGEDLVDAMHCMMENLQSQVGWSLTIGPEYSDLTRQWIKASEGLARPMVELRVTSDMPDDIWEVALNRVLSGGGQPSFYNERVIQQRLADRIPNAPLEDIRQFAGMGCTETSLSGMTCCGGIDANLNVLKVFEEAMKQDLPNCASFDEFYEFFFLRLHRAQDNLMKYVENYYNKRAESSFAPIRTLFTDDCIARERGFFQGGAKYMYSVPSDSGIPNTVDSLLAVKKLIFGQRAYTPAEFCEKLENRDPLFLAKLSTCPSYGAGCEEANELIHDLTSRFYAYYRQGKMTLGLGFFPTSHQFVRHVSDGRKVGATPDGRNSGQPLSDSIAAVNGKAVQGPTAMLRSAACYTQDEVYGIPVLNLGINQKFDPKVLRSLIESYFEMDGTQIQITCTTRERLLEAKQNPGMHRDLIVRIGGYSEYFCRLEPALQDAVIARTMFES